LLFSDRTWFIDAMISATCREAASCHRCPTVDFRGHRARVKRITFPASEHLLDVHESTGPETRSDLFRIVFTVEPRSRVLLYRVGGVARARWIEELAFNLGLNRAGLAAERRRPVLRWKPPSREGAMHTRSLGMDSEPARFPWNMQRRQIARRLHHDTPGERQEREHSTDASTLNTSDIKWSSGQTMAAFRHQVERGSSYPLRFAASPNSMRWRSGTLRPNSRAERTAVYASPALEYLVGPRGVCDWPRRGVSPSLGTSRTLFVDNAGVLLPLSSPAKHMSPSVRHVRSQDRRNRIARRRFSNPGSATRRALHRSCPANWVRAASGSKRMR